MGGGGQSAALIRRPATSPSSAQVIAELRTAGEGRVWNIARYVAIAVHQLDGAAAGCSSSRPSPPGRPRCGPSGTSRWPTWSSPEGTRGDAAAAARSGRGPRPGAGPGAPRAAGDGAVSARRAPAYARWLCGTPWPAEAAPALPASLETSHLANLHDGVAGGAARLSARRAQPASWATRVTAAHSSAELESPGRPPRAAAVASDAAGVVRAQLDPARGPGARRRPASSRSAAAGGTGRADRRLAVLFPGPGAIPLCRAARGAGRLQEAARWYDSFSSNSIFDLIYLAPSHLERGRIAERQGLIKEAASHYEQTVALWLDCDPELRSIPDEARARLAVLRTQVALESHSAPPLGAGRLESPS